MAEHTEEVKAAESLMDKIADKIHGQDSPVSPALESLHEKAVSSGHSASLKAKAYRLFGREKPVHNVFGGGKGTFRDRNVLFVANWSRSGEWSLWLWLIVNFDFV